MSKKMTNTPIVFITDENYVLPTIVAIKSIELSNPDLNANIFILTDKVTSKSRQELEKCTTKNINIEIIENTQLSYSGLEIKNLHVSTAAILKFELPNIFSQFDKILYLDSDILVLKPLTSVLELDIDQEYAAVVKDYKPMAYNPPQPKKLKVDHHAYFNSGVMLLNLKKMREDKITERLYKYRQTGINYFMDQDALNVVFKENVRYISLYYNVISSTVGAFKVNDLADYYELENIKSKNDIYKQAVIIHLTTKYKPWRFANVPFSTEWMSVYKKCNTTGVGQREILAISQRNKIFSGIRVRIRPRDLGIQSQVHVNLTSYPARIENVYRVIRSLQKQTIRVDKIILWLAKSEFPQLQDNLPKDLLSLIGADFDIKWCEDDLKPHKKYFYALKDFPDAVNITVDDDIYYQNDTIESLLISYLRFPYAVSANRAHRMIYYRTKGFAPYKNWQRDVKDCTNPSMELIPTGVGGVLYPPRIFDSNVFDILKIKKCCLYADDLWLKIQEIMRGIPVISTPDKIKLNFIEDSQNTALWKSNDTNNQNDFQLREIINEYKKEGMNLDSRFNDYFNRSVIYEESANINKEQCEKIKSPERKLGSLKSSKSYKIGRAITFLPRFLIKKFGWRK